MQKYVASAENYLYTQLTFVFHPLEIFYIVHDLNDGSFLFLLQEDFCIVHEHIGAFCLFLLQKDFGTFQQPFLKAFLRFFDNILRTFLYIGKIIKKCFISFLYALKIHKLYKKYELCK